MCHIPYKTHWTFRTFYDVLGYSYNFDNRMLSYDLANGTVQKLPESMFTPGFGPFMPIGGYGAPQPFCIARTDNGADILVSIHQADFDPIQAALRLNQDAFGIWKVPGDSFPWAWAPVIINNGFRPDRPCSQKFMYRIADPLTLVTWYDKSTGKVLYTREMAAALDGAVESDAASSGLLPAGQTKKRVPAYFIEDGKVCVRTILGDYICDDNGDYLPEIDTDTEYEAMKRALTEVLRTEGVHDPDPVFYIWTAPFSIDHGVLPKEYALGAGKTVNGETLGCSSCHDALKGRLPQANMAEISSSSELSSLIEKDENGRIKFFGLGRKIVTVPVKIPAGAYKEAVKVFFNSPENPDGTPKYGKMGDKEVMITTSGDILVNALSNGLDVDRHLVPIPVESSGIDGIAFALPGKTSTWKMRFDGVEAEVETEALTGDEVPRRAIVIRFMNELPELLGLEHHAKEMLEASGEGYVPVFTPIIPSEYIEKIKFKLADLKVASPDSLLINYARIHKVRVSEGENVYYELDKENFKPASISVSEAISKGWASYDSYSKEFTVNLAALREGVPGVGEITFALVRKADETITPTAQASAGGGGGGCSLGAPQSASSGLLNLGALLSGLLGLFGFRRKKH